ncbi:hypothetical protein EFA46_000975 [Halarchaeum sp. CBA1220]|uniref:hypothetical protein n=1 Tax=Halarchaeum sp. CBA1220 TaxID=1853682 RepID=UPI000F3AA4B4|nr:hypothetical protein [Halarchaeum sp. CBA1220]QLC32839.1 hypothetical protein EFA46_000975 [Halarchaeum sp. CBA1220]
MASRESVGASHLSLPFDASEANRLSWDLGDEITTRAPRTHTLRADDVRVTARVHDVAGRAVVVLVRTPAGRERHYELPHTEPRDVVATAEARGFRRVDAAPETASA